MTPRTIVLIAAIAAPGCQSTPSTPTVIPPPAIAAVPTATPKTWDSRAELAAWVDNGETHGAAVLVGDGADAVIRVDVSAGDTVLRGPDFDPSLTISAARVRYRWLNKEPNAVLFVTLYLRPSVLNAYLDVPKLFYIQSDLSKPPENASGEWVDELFTAHGLSKPPYSISFASLDVSVAGTYGAIRARSVVEIDRISLIQ